MFQGPEEGEKKKKEKKRERRTSGQVSTAIPLAGKQQEAPHPLPHSGRLESTRGQQPSCYVRHNKVLLCPGRCALQSLVKGDIFFVVQTTGLR